MAAILTTSEQEQAERQAIEEHLQQWASWYSQYRKISSGAIAFATWEEEERAGEEVLEKWDEVCCWLEAHAIYDKDIVYDAVTETATLRPR